MFTRDVMLQYHLEYNHYPPLTNPLYLKYAKLAIDAWNEGDPNRLLTFPDGSEHHASTLVEDWHLECFVENDDLVLDDSW